MFLGGERVQRRIKPMVVCISGLDPTGGAGIQADIETLAAMDCFALPIISSLTVQTTSNVLENHPVNPHVLRRQFDALIESGLEISAIKLGLIDSAQTLLCIAEILKQHSQIPVIADPVLKAGGGYEFVNQQMIDDYIQHILPRCLVLTPNIQELKRLRPLASTEDAALDELCRLGCKYVLLTGTHRQSEDVSNRLFGCNNPKLDKSWSWPRLAYEYHGSGCTLASALVAGVAQGLDVESAAFKAQQFTWDALNRAIPRRLGQSLPDRRHSQASDQASKPWPLLE
jgi:hydroxymethylpyrimidine/phosphomethylpyrimidine kinase